MSLYTFMFVGTAPLGALLAGWVAQKSGRADRHHRMRRHPAGRCRLGDVAAQGAGGARGGGGRDRGHGGEAGMSAGIRVEGLSKSYRRRLTAGPVRALDGVCARDPGGEVFWHHWSERRGQDHAVSAACSASCDPTRGASPSMAAPPDDLAIRRVTGYLPERLVLDRWMSGRDFLAYHHALARLPAAGRREEVEAAIANVGLDREAGSRSIRKYSRGHVAAPRTGAGAARRAALCVPRRARVGRGPGAAWCCSGVC